MWASGLFGPTNPGSTVFAKRPHAVDRQGPADQQRERSTRSAASSHDLTRTHQGWGTPDLTRTYDRAAAGKALVVDETITLPPLQSASFTVNVAAGEPDLRATLVWSDPPGTTSATQHRINDLDLKVTSPSGHRLLGQPRPPHGELEHRPAAAPNSIDTVENVFVQNPQAGHLERHRLRGPRSTRTATSRRPPIDADFALVVTGATPQAAGSAGHGSAELGRRVDARERRHEPERTRTRSPAFPDRSSRPRRVGRTARVHLVGAPRTADVILAMGPLHRNNVVFPGVGSLDVGLLGPGPSPTS